MMGRRLSYIGIFSMIMLGSFFFCEIVFAQDMLEISMDGVSEDGEIRVVRGGIFNERIFVENFQNTKINIILFLKDAQDKTFFSDTESSLVSNTVFLEDMPNEDIQKILNENKNDIVNYCKKDHDDQRVRSWCQGNREIELSIEPGEKKEVMFMLKIGQNEKDHNFYVVAEKAEDRQEIVRKKFMYRVPDRNITQIDLKEFTLQKVNDQFGSKKFFEKFSQDYQAYLVGENVGTEDVNVDVFVTVESKWFGKKMHFQETHQIMAGKKGEAMINVILPPLGMVHAYGGIKYATSAGEIKKSISEPIDFLIFPLREILIFSSVICFCAICVLLYKYINKNMFNFRKNKKGNEVYGGSYIVQDTDNIISIAQKFNVSWKELAKNNKIEPPYILIKGESISVPLIHNDSEKQSQKNIMSLWQKKDGYDRIDSKKDDAVVPETMNDENTGQKDGGDLSTNSSFRNGENAGSFKVESETQKDQNNNIVRPAQGQINKKSNVIFASPQNMLAQSASEPTTRAIDIEWMRDDEEAYMEEMQVQQKKANIHLIAGGFVICVFLIVGGWFGVSYMIKNSRSAKTPVESLLQDDVAAVEIAVKSNDVEIHEEDVLSNAAQIHEESNDHANDDQKNDDNTNVNFQPQDVIVQVLNAGAKTGAAGVVTQIIKKQDYKTLPAQNAKNDHVNVTIYYDEKYAEQAVKVAELVSKEDFGVQKQEISTDIVEQYNAHIVVVLGKKE